MEVNLFSAFDFHSIAQHCWKTCDSKNGIYEFEVDDSSFPPYRDRNTFPEFLEVANFFGCVDICQTSNESKKFALLVPICLGCEYN